jgi:hypothetical protein
MQVHLSDFFSAATRYTFDASKVELRFTCHSPFKPIAVQLPQKRVIESSQLVGLVSSL